MADLPDGSPPPSPTPSQSFLSLTRPRRSHSSASRRTLSPSLYAPSLHHEASLLPSTRSLFPSPRRPLLSHSYRRTPHDASALTSAATSAHASSSLSRHYVDERLEQETSLLLSLPLLPVPSPGQTGLVNGDSQAARERAAAEDEADTAQAAAFLLSPVRSPKRKRQASAPKDGQQPPSRPTRSNSGSGRVSNGRTQRSGSGSSAANFTDLDQLFSGDLLLDDGDDDDEVYEPTTPNSSSSASLLPKGDAIAGRTRARNPVDLSWDELEQQSGNVLDMADAELDMRNRRKRKRGDLLSPVEDEAGAELASELSMLDAGSELPLPMDDDYFQRFVISMNNDAPLSEDDEEFIPPPADDDEDEYRDDRSTRVSRRELRELRGDAQMMQQEEELDVEIDTETLQIIDVSKRKRHRQLGSSAEHPLLSPPLPGVYDTRASSFTTSFDPHSSPSIHFNSNTSHSHPALSSTSAPQPSMPSPFVLPQVDVSIATSVSADQAISSHTPSVAAAASSSGPLSSSQLLLLRHQFNDHVQLLIQSRCLAQWWPEQNSDVQSIVANIGAMMEELTALTDERSPSNAPLLNLWRAIEAEEQQTGSPLVLPTSKPLRHNRRVDVPQLDEWYNVVQQQRPMALRSTLQSIVLNCDWNPRLRIAFHLRRAPMFTHSEDELLKLAFLPGGTCHSPAGLPIYPDWVKVQQRYLPSKSAEEIRKRFQNIRSKDTDEQHPLRRVQLPAGSYGAKLQLSDDDMARVEAGLKEGGRGAWAKMCRTSFAGWDRRSLKRTYDKCKRTRDQSGGVKAEKSNLESLSSLPASPDRIVSTPTHQTSCTSSPSRVKLPPTMSLPSTSSSSVKVEAAPSVLCDGGAAGVVKWSKDSDRQLLTCARLHGLVVEQWPYATVSQLQVSVTGADGGPSAGVVGVSAISARLDLLLKLITQQRQHAPSSAT